MEKGERGWRVLQSFWVLIPLLTVGWLAGLAFLYAGLRARKRSWLFFAVLYGITGITGFILIDPDRENLPDQIGFWLTVGTLMIGTIHALVIRPAFLERISGGHRRRPQLETAEAILEERRAALEIVEEDPLKARELGIGNPGAPGGYHGHLVDLNHASADAIAALPRMDATIAARAVALRDEVGGFASLADAGEVLDLPPATVERLRGLAICLPY